MKKIKRIRRSSFPLFIVVKARKVEGSIEAKVKQDLQGITTTSPWTKIDPKHYWINDKKYSIRKITDNVCEHLKDSKVRIPKLEKEHRVAIRKQQNNIYRRNNNV